VLKAQENLTTFNHKVALNTYKQCVEHTNVTSLLLEDYESIREFKLKWAEKSTTTNSTNLKIAVL
jgi:hypothetical protein